MARPLPLHLLAYVFLSFVTGLASHRVARWASRQPIGRRSLPEGEPAKHAPLRSRDRLSAGRSIAHFVVRLMKDHATDTCRLGPGCGIAQVRFGGYAQHYYVTLIL